MLTFPLKVAGMKYATINSKRQVAMLVIVGTGLAFVATHVLTYYVIGAEQNPMILRATVICPLVIAPIMLIFLGITMLKGTQLRLQLQNALERYHLTDIFNRKYFFERIDRLPAKTKATILMIDVDLFKKVNDTYGHFVGDAVIRCVAQTLADTVRSTDFVARFGGGEFVAFLHGDDLPGARALAERFRGAIEQSQIETPAGIVHVTVSVGMGASDQDKDLSVVDAVNEADRALLDAKEQGRNRVILASSIATKIAA